MKINPIASNWDVYKSTNVHSVDSAKKTAGKRDTFTISNVGQDFGTVLRALTNVSDVREDKVGAIKQKMSEGTYNIGSEEIAEKIFSNAFGARA